jgi:peptide/nickel transport system permease protein
MGRFVVRRVVHAVPLLIGISMIAFLLLQAIPGDPTVAYRGTATVSERDLERIRDELGLDRPLAVQYASWLRQFVQGDWGVSYVASRPVLGMVAERLPATLELMAAGLVVSVLVAIPLGLIAAVRQYSWADYLLTFASFVGLSMPIFWVGLMLIVVFSLELGWFPSGGRGPPGEDPDLVTRLRYLTLPALSLALVQIGFFTRYLRASMLDVLGRDFMRFARARGVPPVRLYLRHGFRNAAIPFVTVVALHVPDYLIGALVVETIFSWPGTGRLFWESAVRFDYPVLMGVLVLASLLVIVSNLVADVLYGLLDPRIRYD